MDTRVSNVNLHMVEADIRRLFTPFGEGATEIKWNNCSTGRALVSMPVGKQQGLLS